MSNADIIVALAGLMLGGLLLWGVMTLAVWADEAEKADPPAYKRKDW